MLKVCVQFGQFSMLDVHQKKKTFFFYPRRRTQINGKNIHSYLVYNMNTYKDIALFEFFVHTLPKVNTYIRIPVFAIGTNGKRKQI